jgi:hypothetical protein
MSDQKDVVEIVEIMALSLARAKYGDGDWSDFPDHAREIADDQALDQIVALEAKGYFITRGSHGVRHRQEPFESK